MAADGHKEFNPALEGLRGYAFLLVFALHYAVAQSHEPGLFFRGLALLVYLGRIAVPLFFVLSGYLITGILYRTQDRDGFFRVYYWRRALRILPAYYAALAFAAVLALATRTPLGAQNLLLLVFAQNLWPTSMGPGFASHSVLLLHFWSLAVEEQFYLTWPLVIWALRDRRRILWACYIGIVAVNLLRFAWPVHFMNPANAYIATPVRVDAILLGCILSLHLQVTKLPSWSVPVARVVTASSLAALLIWHRKLADCSSVAAVRMLYPLMSLIGLAIMVQVLGDPYCQRVCMQRPIRFIGRMSYGLYLLHCLYLPWFSFAVMAEMHRYLPLLATTVLTRLLAFSLTIVLGLASYHLIEMPALAWRDRVHYGEKKVRRVKVILAHVEIEEPALLRMARLAGRQAVGAG